MPEEQKPLLIKRYASRRLYNTETSDYVTLEDIAGFIRDGRDVKVIDLKSGDDLTRQYLLQIVAERESKGESVLPIEVLTDLVRSYTSQANSIVPQFLQMSFDMLRKSQANMIGPMVAMPGFGAVQKQQEAFLKAMTGGWTGATGPMPEPSPAEEEVKEKEAELDEIRRQLSEMQAVLKKMNG